MREAPHKLVLKPVKMRGKLFFQQIEYFPTNCVTKNFEYTSFPHLDSLFAHYSNIHLLFCDEEYFINGNKVKRKAASCSQELRHNKPKKHLLPEGEPYDFLVELGIMKKDGTVLASKRDKFIQIQKFLELIQEMLQLLVQENKTVRIVDFGCGKAYLTFALYYFLTHLGATPLIEGIDVKKEVVDTCSELAKRCGYTGLSFSQASIQTYEPRHCIDFACSLHACNTASDWAIYKSIRYNAKAIAIAPCCQHEVASSIHKEAFPLLLRHGIVKERFSSLLTDALRAEVISLYGYTTDIVEFVDSQHTPKNLLIRAVKKGKEKPYALSKEIKELCATYRIQPTLLKLLEDDCKDASDNYPEILI